jgi:hypothetical protein
MNASQCSPRLRLVVAIAGMLIFVFSKYERRAWCAVAPQSSSVVDARESHASGCRGPDVAASAARSGVPAGRARRTRLALHWVAYSGPSKRDLPRSGPRFMAVVDQPIPIRIGPLPAVGECAPGRKLGFALFRKRQLVVERRSVETPNCRRLWLAGLPAARCSTVLSR